jgi:hypothetical protein
MVPNQRFEGSAEERRSSVPVALRAPAPPQPQRSASCGSAAKGRHADVRAVAADRVAADAAKDLVVVPWVTQVWPLALQ